MLTTCVGWRSHSREPMRRWCATRSSSGSVSLSLRPCRELNEQVFRLYADGRQGDALRLLDAADDALTPWQAELAYVRACLYGSLGQPDRAMAALAAAAAEGAWWDPAVLAHDDDLTGARELAAF